LVCWHITGEINISGSGLQRNEHVAECLGNSSNRYAWPAKVQLMKEIALRAPVFNMDLPAF